MAHDGSPDWKLTKPPPGQSAVDFLLFLIDSVLPTMNVIDPDLSWEQKPPRHALILETARVHEDVAVAFMEAAGFLVRFFPPYSPDFNPVKDVFSVGSSWLRRHVTPEQFFAWPFTSLTTIFLHVPQAMCASFVKAAVHRYTSYVPE